jgi:hypothetical protein
MGRSEPPPPKIPLPWYRDGLRFTCTQCGNCCTGDGYVWLSPAEIKRLAAGLKMEVPEFMLRYVRLVDEAFALIDNSKSKDCVFLDEARRCSVYEDRPQQCRTWPFWEGNLTNARAWKTAQARCPGAGHGRLHTLDEIRTIVDSNGAG